ncbi:MAG: Riboflavin transporter [Holosporales bacterium]
MFYKSFWAFIVLLLTRVNQPAFFKSIRHSSFKPNIIRALIGSVGVILWIRSVQCLPLRDVSALSLTSSFFSAFGGYLLYKEPMNRYKNIGLLIGFLGACIIIHPHFKQKEWLYLFPLLSAFCFGISALLARYLAKRDQEHVTSFYLFLTMVIVSAPYGAQFNIPMTDLFILMAIGISYGISQLLYVKSYVYAETSYLAPVKYIKVPLHLLAGLLLFQEIPTVESLVGIAILFLALSYASKS